MGKTKKSRKFAKFGDKINKPQPLADQILQENEVTIHDRNKKRINNTDTTVEYVGGTLGQNIIKQSRIQLQEVNDEEFPPLGTVIKRERPKEKVDVYLHRTSKKSTFKKSQTRKTPSSDSENSESESIDENIDATPLNIDKIIQDFEADMNLDEEDLKALEHFKKKDSGPQKRLADFFKDNITEKFTEIQSNIDAESTCGAALNPLILSLCKEVGKVLHHYRSGPLPKMLKSSPSMVDWERILHETEPDKWTAAAVYQVTRIFVSNLKASMAQRFCSLILLPRIRDDISFYRRLNYHLYQALVKALYKPSAFFKGIIFPLCSEGECTLREAIIIGSVMANNRIPMIYSAAALETILSWDYQGANYILLRVLFDKKYALPYHVIDNAVEHFARFVSVRESLPVLWHQALLAFVQRYKNDITADQKDALFDLISVQGHYKVTPQIRRELESATNREAMNIG